MWIDTHAHLDAAELDAGRAAMLERAARAGVGCVVVPAVEPSNFAAVRELAHAHGHAYALGVHPLYVARLRREDLRLLREELQCRAGDPRLVAVGEIGLDHFVEQDPAGRAEQAWWLDAQLELAAEFALPVLLHVRRAQDAVAAALRRRAWGAQGRGGIAHAFNGSEQQARAFLAQGLCLGFGGTLSFERSRNIRRLAQGLPEEALVLETDAPDMAPQWIAHGPEPRPNEPAELPRIGAVLAGLRGWTPQRTAALTAANALRVLPRLAALLAGAGGAPPARP
ncbi:MAG: TatD family hydrolase [Betaproteobacteria bacterium]|nr:TatD family hydrolase [Betaproteobacteria bacterium]MBU6514092.1 TatD family hydrolase [Betaproteobacteria bacterium]MDE1957142.1 TatD family hydrolase [Betaproteobacteria bacterium]MDE2152769.1 TatD family hydrolase [Betaproteobacteria bacterium]